MSGEGQIHSSIYWPFPPWAVRWGVAWSKVSIPRGNGDQSFWQWLHWRWLEGGVGGLETVPASFSCFRHIKSPPGCVFPVLASGRGRKQWGRKLVPQDPMRVQRERGTGPGGDPRPPRHGTRWTGAGRVVGVESGLGAEVTTQIGGGWALTTRSTTFAMCLGDGDGSPQLGFSAPRLTPFLVK
jgi:hypothetical protein